MKDGELKIHSLEKDQPPAEREPPKPVGADDPFAEEPASPPVSVMITSQLTQVYAKLLADVRVGVFVEIEGEIESTNALHRQDNLITLLRINLGKMLQNPEATERFKTLEKLKHSPNRRQQMQLISEQMEGFDVDTQDPIVVRLR